MATASDFIQALSRAFVLAESRAGDDPELLDSYETVQNLQKSLGWQVMRVEEGGITFPDQEGEEVAAEGDPARLRSALQESGIQELRLQDPMDPSTLDTLFRRLQSGGEDEDLQGSDRFRGLEEFLGLSFQRRHGPLRGMSGSIQALFDARAEEGGEAGRSRAGRGREPATDRSADRPVLSPDLQGKVEAFYSTTGQEREQLAEEIRAEAARMKDARNLTGAADLLEVLADGGPGEPDPRAVALARRIIFPGAASHLVARIGAGREETGRNRLIRISSRLGREMAVALADALGEARDRFQRRIFLDALVAQGDLAMEMAQGMVEDPRWFVVRNGVALMGEISGEDRISDLTGPLAHDDPRVRRETVLALSKIGGEDARLLLLGMLDDSDAEVRAVACRAVGLLKVERALRPLLRILDSDHDENVQVECLEALGKIEDPGAVPLIQKRAVGGLFSRPSTEVRVAAYRALAGIGTPHAKDLLKKAATDSDPEVRSVVQSLLG